VTTKPAPPDTTGTDVDQVSLPPLSPLLLRAQSSGIREIATAARLIPGAIRLDTGEPNFRTPQHIAEAGKDAIDKGLTHYTDTQGILPLRQALAEKLERVNGLRTTPEQIVCGPGGVGVLAAALAALLAPGDEILLPDPGWPNTSIMTMWLGGKEVRYRCESSDGFIPDFDQLEALITPKTKVLLINSPNNPTGAVYDDQVLARLASIASRHNLWVVSDECYDQILLSGSGAAPSIASFIDRDRVVSVFTFSKTYAMTGWRLGYGVAHADVVESMVKFLSSSSSSISSITQWAGLAAIIGPQQCVADMVSAYRRRREIAVTLLREAGLLVSEPKGAFYIMANVASSGLTGRQFAFQLLSEMGVSVTPGSAFGEIAESAVRVSLASSDEDLVEGLGRLCEFSSARSSI